jgi:hypothetical protein
MTRCGDTGVCAFSITRPLTVAQRSTTMSALSGTSCRAAPSPYKPRHMDVYPSRNVDIRSLRVPAPQNNKNACGDRLRSAGAFLD